MKLLAVATLAAGIGLGSVALADEHGNNGCESKKAPSPEKMLKRMSKKLDLSDEQKKQMRVIMEEQHESMKAHRDEMRAMRQASREKMMVLLDDDQKEKFKKMKRHRKGKGKDERGKKHHDECDD